jgi:hypothetical protein
VLLLVFSAHTEKTILLAFGILPGGDFQQPVRQLFWIVLAAVAFGQFAANSTAQVVSAGKTYGRLPLSFEPNQGQTDSRVKFLVRASGYTLFMTAQEAVFVGREGSVERMKLLGSNRNARVEPLEKQPGISNYFIGNDPSKWRTNIPNYGRVALRNVYPGIDLIFYGKDRQLEYDWAVAPGADPKQIRVRWGGTKEITKNITGDLVLTSSLRQKKPVILQEGKPIEGGYVIRGKEVGFEVATYDVAKPLVIDPVLVYSTYLGGGGLDAGNGIAVDGAGNAYVMGATTSTNFPTADSEQASSGGNYDSFVTKINAAGTALVYSTYLGGTRADYGSGIAVDSLGNAYVTGVTDSSDFPTANPLQAGSGGGNDVFVTKLDSRGDTILFSTYLGGSGDDYGAGIAVDTSDNAYVTGYTQSTDFPTTSPLQRNYGGAQDAFVSKITTAGTALVYSTYLGGSGPDYGFGIAVDSAGSAYVTGLTNSANFPTANPLQASNGGTSDAFVTKINAVGSALVYSTYLGGSGTDQGQGIVVDGAGNAYITGQTASTNFPTSNALQLSNAGSADAFVTKLNAAGSALVYSTYLGGSNTDVGYGIAVDSMGNANITGFTSSTNFPTANPLQAGYGGDTGDAFATKINAAGSALVYSTFLGGNGLDVGNAIAVDISGNAYITGNTASMNFPATNALQTNYGGNQDAFVSLIGTSSGITITTASTLPQGTVGTFYSQSLAASGGVTPYSWTLISGTLPSGLSLSSTGALTGTPTSAGASSFTARVTDSAASSAMQTFFITIAPAALPLSITTNPTLPSGTVGAFYSQSFEATGGRPPYTWSLGAGVMPAGLSLSTGGSVTGTPATAGPSSFTVRVTDSASSSATQTFSLTIVGGLTVTTGASLPSGTIGTFYTQMLSASGGTTPYSWSFVSGTLPSGLSFSNSGAISGTPTAGGSFSFIARVTDAASSSATRTFNLTISAPSGPSFIGSVPHIAAEENWNTLFTLVNKGIASAQTQLSFFGDPNGSLTLPLTFPQQSSASGPIFTTALGQTISSNASLIVQTAGPQTPPVLVGSAQLAATGAVDGFAIFHLIPGAQEAFVPLETRNANSYLLAFDNTGGVVLGVAVENVSAQAGSIGIVIRDDTGAQIGSGTISMLANGHTSFVLSTQYPVTANKRGTVEFDTPPGGQISVLGIRTTPLGTTNTLTTIPALANVGSNGGSIAHLATGNGWQTTFVLVNSGTNAAQVNLNFFADVTGAPLSLPVSFPQVGSAVSTVSSVTQTLAAGATLLVQSAAPLSNPAPTTGSAQLTTSGNVSGFVIFRYNPNGQEAVVPLESRTANGYLIAFDNTAGTATGIALNSISSQTVNVPVVVRDDAGNQIATDTLNLAANGHLAFTLATDKYPMTANIRGTIEFDTPAGGQIGALGIRIPVGHTFTTLPALAK